jgi:hypothetical protein
VPESAGLEKSREALATADAHRHRATFFSTLRVTFIGAMSSRM